MNPNLQDVSLLLDSTGIMPAVQWADEQGQASRRIDPNSPFSLIHERLAERSMRRTPVGALMSTQVRCLSASATVQETARVMQANDDACIVFVDQNRPVGIVTERDMIRILSGILDTRPAERYYIKDFMSAPPICMNENASLYDALTLVQSHHLKQIPVVDAADQVTGLLTREQVARAHLAAVEQERDTVEQQIRDRSRELSEANRALKALALQDSLLKVGNRRAMEMDVQATHGNAIRYNQCYAVALVDVDFFKRYNDCYGHGAGDRALIAVANCIKDSVRRGDRVYRYGGEEFLVLMPEATLHEADEAAQRLVRNVFQTKIAHSESLHRRLTISVGVNAFDGKSNGIANWESIVETADSLLYRAKTLGRNQVCGVARDGPACRLGRSQ